MAKLSEPKKSTVIVWNVAAWAGIVSLVLDVIQLVSQFF
jgi:hypothetical protein